MCSPVYSPLPTLSPELSDRLQSITSYQQYLALEKELVLETLQQQAPLWLEFDYFSKYLNDLKLRAVLKSSMTLDVSWHQNIAALITGLLHFSSSSSSSYLSEAIQQAIKSFQQSKSLHRLTADNVFGAYELLSNSSREGVVMQGGMRSDLMLYIIKTPKGEDSLPHEALVGLSLNQVRELVPNFMYTYSYTQCTGPQIDSHGDVQSFCDVEENSSVLLLELVRDAVPWSRFVHFCSPRELELGLLQVINALQVANTTVGFIHGDLHGENILVRDFKTEVPIKIYNQKLEVVGVLKSRFVPYIIDFGFSTARVYNPSTDGYHEFLSTGQGVAHHVGLEYLRSDYPMLDLYHLLDLTLRSVGDSLEKREILLQYWKVYPDFGLVPKTEPLIPYEVKKKMLGSIDPKVMSKEEKKRELDQYWLKWYGYQNPVPSNNYEEMVSFMTSRLQELNIVGFNQAVTSAETTCEFKESTSLFHPEILSLADFWTTLYGLDQISDYGEVERLLPDLDDFDLNQLLLSDLHRLEVRIKSIDQKLDQPALVFTALGDLEAAIQEEVDLVQALSHIHPFSQDVLSKLAQLQAYFATQATNLAEAGTANL